MRFRALAAIVLAGGVLGSGWLPASATPASAPTTWEVTAGAESADFGTQTSAFYPAQITVNVGDSIRWTVPTKEFHNVAFPSGQPAPDFLVPTPDAGTPPSKFMFNPAAAFPAGGDRYDGKSYVNSGLLDNGKSWTVTFTAPGTFQYLCSVHPLMKAEVRVQPEGSSYPMTPQQVAAQAQQQRQADLQRGQTLIGGAGVKRQAGANGATTYRIANGLGDERVSVDRFLPGDLTIRAGDTVVWEATDPQTPHTVTFLAGAKEPEVVLPQPQGQGPPLLVVNPDVLLPRGPQVYGGSGYVNSGIYGGDVPGPRSFQLTFDRPGTYAYICALHEEMGMRGRIIVQAAGAGAAQPAAGPAAGAAPPPATQLPRTGEVPPLLPPAALGLSLGLGGWLLRRKV